MSDEDSSREFWRWQGRIEERVNNKAERSEIAEALKRAAEMDALAEQRGRDLLAAHAEDNRRDSEALKKRIAMNGEETQRLGRALSDFRLEQQARDDKQSATMAYLREEVTGLTEALTKRKINWFEWARWGMIIVILFVTAATGDFGALLAFLK